MSANPAARGDEKAAASAQTDCTPTLAGRRFFCSWSGGRPEWGCSPSERTPQLSRRPWRRGSRSCPDPSIAAAVGADAVDLEMMAVDGEPCLGREPRLKLLDVAVAVEADDAAATAADERVAVSDGWRGVTDLAAPVLHAGEQAEVAEERDCAIDGSLADALRSDGVGQALSLIHISEPTRRTPIS